MTLSQAEMLLLKNLLSKIEEPTVEEQDDIKFLIHQKFAPGITVLFDDKEGTVDTMERDGTVHVWFGEFREIDGAKICQPVNYQLLTVK